LRTTRGQTTRDRKTGYEALAEENNTSVEAIAKAAGRINRKKADDLKKSK